MSYAADKSTKAVTVIVHYLVAIFVLSQIQQLTCTLLSRSKAVQFLDEVFYDGMRYSVQYQLFVKFVHVAQKGYWRRRVFPGVYNSQINLVYYFHYIYIMCVFNCICYS